MHSNWFVGGDVDGFFGLFFDNLTNLMLIAVLGATVCGFPAELLAAAAVLSLIGLIHGYELKPQGVRNVFELAAAPGYPMMYTLGAVFLIGIHALGNVGKR